MIGLMKHWRAVGSGVAIFLIVGMGLTIQVKSEHNRALQHEKRMLMIERDRANAVFKHYAAATQLFNQISREVHHDKQEIKQENELRMAHIRSALRQDACAGVLVPVAVSDALRLHADKIRSATATDHPR